MNEDIIFFFGLLAVRRASMCRRVRPSLDQTISGWCSMIRNALETEREKIRDRKEESIPMCAKK
jgi:hypothetical protein